MKNIFCHPVNSPSGRMKKGASVRNLIAGSIMLITVLSVFLSGCAPRQGSELTVVLDWTPNTNHIGLYTALERGYFSDRGLNVKIIQPGDNYAVQLVASGRADFGVSYQEEVTFARTAGIPVKSVAAVLAHNTSCFAAPVQNGIESVRDFAGKDYGGWGGEAEVALLKYLMDKEGLNQMPQVINLGSSDFFSAAASGSIDFSWIFYGWTGIEAELRQVELSTVFLTDLDAALDYYTPVLIAEEGYLEENAETAKLFLAAVLEGYRYADQNPLAAADMLLKHAPGLSAELVRASAEWLSGRYADGPFESWGYQRAEVWNNYSDWLYQNGLLDTPFDAAAAYTNLYLP